MHTDFHSYEEKNLQKPGTLAFSPKACQAHCDSNAGPHDYQPSAFRCLFEQFPGLVYRIDKPKDAEDAVERIVRELEGLALI
jgi:hypothetical protein